MEKVLIICFLLVFGISIESQSQIGVSNLTKQVSADATKKMLGNLDSEMKKQFKLDGVKSEIAGDVLKMKVADSDFASMTNNLRTSTGNNMLEQAVKLAKGNGINLKGLGIKSVVLEMVKGLSVNEVLTKVSKKL